MCHAQPFSRGDGEDRDLRRATRAHGNFVETLPFAWMLPCGLAMMQAPARQLHALAVSLLLSRLLHRAGLRGPSSASTERALGMALLWVTMAAGAIDLVRRAPGQF